MMNFGVLLVDDENDFRDTLVKRLKKRQLNLREAENGKQAIEIVKEGGIDVVILDVRMPGLDGIQTLRMIKQTDPLIEVVMLTGHANLEVAVEGMELGAFDYLMKPMDIDELVFKLQDAFTKKRMHQEKIKKYEKTIQD